MKSYEVEEAEKSRTDNTRRVTAGQPSRFGQEQGQRKCDGSDGGDNDEEQEQEKEQERRSSSSSSSSRGTRTRTRRRRSKNTEA